MPKRRRSQNHTKPKRRRFDVNKQRSYNACVRETGLEVTPRSTEVPLWRELRKLESLDVGGEIFKLYDIVQINLEPKPALIILIDIRQSEDDTLFTYLAGIYLYSNDEARNFGHKTKRQYTLSDHADVRAYEFFTHAKSIEPNNIEWIQFYHVADRTIRRTEDYNFIKNIAMKAEEAAAEAAAEEAAEEAAAAAEEEEAAEEAAAAEEAV